MVSPAYSAFHRPLFSQHQQISTVVAVSADDARPRVAGPGLLEWPVFFCAQSAACLWPRSVFLFPFSLGAGPRLRRPSACIPLRFSFLFAAAAASLGGPRAAFPSDYGFSLPVVYLAWLAVVAISYPICLWYANLKNRRRDLWWLSYL